MQNACLGMTVTQVVSLWWVWLLCAIVPTTAAVVACLCTACVYARWRRRRALLESVSGQLHGILNYMHPKSVDPFI